MTRLIRVVVWIFVCAILGTCSFFLAAEAVQHDSSETVAWELVTATTLTGLYALKAADEAVRVK